jgi:hypothetical protein
MGQHHQVVVRVGGTEWKRQIDASREREKGADSWEEKHGQFKSDLAPLARGPTCGGAIAARGASELIASLPAYGALGSLR